MKQKEREHKLPKSRMKEDTLLGSTKIKMGCQQALEKMLNIYNHQRNVNQNHNEISPQTCQHGYHQKEQKQQMLTRIWRKREPSYTVDRNANWCSHNGRQYGGFTKAKNMTQKFHF